MFADRPRGIVRGLLALSLASALAGACTTPGRVPFLHDPTMGPSSDGSGILKVHLHSGELLTLSAWSLEADTVLVGDGARYSAERVLVSSGAHRLAIDSVALFEGSVEARDLNAASTLAVVPLVAWTAISGAVTILCLADPKSCFGSCPTFYVEDDAGTERLVAEGFSASIARVLEARDLDAMPELTVPPGRFEIVMRNEALETHAVRAVRLVAVPRGEGGGAVVATPNGTLLPVERRLEATRCRGADGDCLASVRDRDGSEWRSWTDGRDLAARETLELEFPATGGPLALAITARHTFVSTFLFYQGLAYLGSQAGTVMAALERGDPVLRERITGPMRELGGLHVYVEDGAGGWTRAGTFEEAGPLAADQHAIRLPDRRAPGPLRVRLDLVRGYWRIDEVALVVTGDAVAPLTLPVAGVRTPDGPDPDALRRLLDPRLHLVTWPGHEYTLTFDLPEAAGGYQVFLESEGYYYEWMREEWLDEEDPVAAALMLTRPHEMFRRLAPAFKEREATMEEIFWESRVGRRQP